MKPEMSLTVQEQHTLQQFKKALGERFGSDIVEIRVFGSKARGDAGPESDLDVLVVTERDDWRLKEQIGRVATGILLEEGIYLSIKVFGRSFYQQLVEMETPFIKNVLRESIPV